MNNSVENKSDIINILVINILAILVLYYFQQNGLPFHLDDMFIPLSYVKNFTEGQGLTFNSNSERIFAFTSPLHVILLLAASFFSTNHYEVSIFLSYVLFTLTINLVYLISRKYLIHTKSLLISLFFLFNGSGSYWHLGLESSLLCFLLLLALCLYLYELNLYTISFILSLAFLTRYDSIFFLAAYVINIIFFKKDPTIKTSYLLLASLAPILFWAIFCQAYFGSVIPNSFYAKKDSSIFSEYILKNLITVFSLKKINLIYMKECNYTQLLIGFFSLVLSMTLGSFFLREVRKVKDYFIISFLFIIPLVVLCAYGVIGAPITHNWEVHSSSFIIMLSILIGLCLSVQYIKNNKQNFDTVFLVILCCIGLIEIIKLPSEYKKNFWIEGRYSAYLNLNHWLNTNVKVGSSIALPEVGIANYLSDSKFRLIDLNCIVSKSIDYVCFPENMIKEYKPEFIINWKFEKTINQINKGTLKYTKLVNIKNYNFFEFDIYKREG